MIKVIPSALLALCLSSPAMAGVIFKYDFDAANPWPTTAVDVMPATPLPVEPTIDVAPVGTIVKAGTAEASGALQLTAEIGDATGEWHAIFASGLLPSANAETDLGKLTLAFDLSASIARPITVRFESFDAQKRRTGGLESVVYPAAPDFFVRSAIDLSKMTPSGAGKFNPTDPFVQISYVVSGPDFPSSAKHIVRIDNVNYSSPAFYVSPSGNNASDGLTEATALSDPQNAVDRAKPGDIILIMNGTYGRGPDNDEQEGVVEFLKGGAPDAWVVLKNYPGHTPIIKVEGWNAIRLGRPVKEGAPKPGPMAYIEIRGLHVRGDADKVMQNHAADLGLPKWTTNGNGIGGTGEGHPNVPHHLRLADNLVEYCPGGGLGVSHWDWVVYENNISRNNSWFTIYATSGMGTLGTSNFDTTSNVYKVLIRNNRLSWNRTYLQWKQIGKVSDGNGLIVDSIHDPAKNLAYLGRTLIQNNISTHNGGSGIHCFKAHQVDIINNTAYMNGASPELRWGQIFVQRTNDARIINNILYARDDQPVNTVGRDISDKGNTNILRANNLYFNGSTKPIMGDGDLFADPLFISAMYHLDTSNFRLQPGSPALGFGRWEPFSPLTDIDGKRRPLTSRPDAGAFQH